MGEVAVDGELDDLGVDEDEFEFVGAEAVDQRENEITDTDGFAGSGGAGDEGVRCAGEVEDDVTAGDIDAEDEGSSPVALRQASDSKDARRARGRSGDWGFRRRRSSRPGWGPGCGRRWRKGRARDFFEGDDRFNADTEAGFDAELSDARADDRVVDEGVDREAVEGVLENALVGGEFLGTGKVFRRPRQDGGSRERDVGSLRDRRG